MKIAMIRRGKNISLIVGVIFCSVFLGGCGVDRSGVEIVSEPIAKVYLNGKEVGMTPYKNNTLKSGEIEIKLDDRNGNFWEKRIKLESNVTSVVNYSFDANKDSGYVLSMEKTGNNGSVLINSNPGGAMIYIDGELKTSTPAKIENVPEGDRKLSISYPGYKNINLIVKVVRGYQLIVDSKMEKEERAETVYPSNPIPTRTTGQKIKIKETETGWLRVRSLANNAGAEVGRAKPGEVYEMVSESANWYQINFQNEKAWISAKYAEKISE